MNYDETHLGVFNPMHPANQIEVNEMEIVSLSITCKFEALEASKFESEQCNEFYLELSEIEKKAAKFEEITQRVKSLNHWKNALRELYNEKAFEVDSDYKRNEIQLCLDNISKAKKSINKICGI